MTLMLRFALLASLTLAGQVSSASTPDPAQKSQAAKTQEAKLPSNVELIKQLKDQSVVNRRTAAQQLGARGVRAVEAVPAMIEALGDSEAVVRSSVAEALGGIGVTAKASVPTLLKLLKDADAGVRETAAEALADIGADAPKVVPALLELLSDKDMNVRCAAAKSLGDYRSAAQDAIPALKKLQQQDKHPFVREAAAEALDTISKAIRRLDS
jgi:HEAT repeat protein